jgi:hypothetical protein
MIHRNLRRKISWPAERFPETRQVESLLRQFKYFNNHMLQYASFFTRFILAKSLQNMPFIRCYGLE